MNEQNRSDKIWLKHLEEDDLAFMKRFLLNSGSLKQMATDYGVSYPTVRLRLDRLIQKIRLVDEQTTSDSFQILLATMLTDGKLEQGSFRKIHESYLQQKRKDTDENTSHNS